MIDKVLGSQTKVKIILTLWRHGEMNMAALVEKVGAAHQTVIQQLEQLIDYGVVEARQVGRMRLFRIARDPAFQQLAEALARADEWLATRV
ncbi:MULTISPECIES: helix-turn-helix transcriptional regulator [Pyrobaculum]|uniref:Transcriptional regulator, ArsR family n=4 Tax=Pyrobaculum TaxID=2276 RepID=A4WJ55_PYRAR|nr:winged helix-turn-helix domain-containing protein [Pyrobaculum arsenaticum]ABP50422.1 transcriptional regulator, ArsR family [Pyrobaculum arsenaticum DSM 13514]AFA39524.1 Sugar-specific transcriptional regulator TrmB [Pyrobaculum oguniense TE7]MCY0890410.1 winged helix-turn-helix domain-containing protein [Pyrobaculum arsenaticum]NYR14634.1 winged helix-turn-helix transcriptional regulator [Pyrobaculum arsenaticum]